MVSQGLYVMQIRRRALLDSSFRLHEGKLFAGMTVGIGYFHSNDVWA